MLFVSNKEEEVINKKRFKENHFKQISLTYKNWDLNDKNQIKLFDKHKNLTQHNLPEAKCGAFHFSVVN